MPAELVSLTAISPLDGRYGRHTAELRDIFSEFAFMRERLRVEVAWLSGHSSYVVDLAFSQDGKLLASTGFDRTLRIWRAPSWAEIDEAEAGSTRTP